MEPGPEGLSGLREDLREAILRAAGAREVYLFGSAAKGKLREASDIDLAVVGLPPRVFFKAMAKAHAASRIDRHKWGGPPGPRRTPSSGRRW